MKRRWFGAAIALSASIAFVLSYAPSASANSTGAGCPAESTNACTILQVTIHSGPGTPIPSNAVAQATRQTPNPKGDNQFSLTITGINADSSAETFSSVKPIAGSALTDATCSPSVDTNYQNNPINLFSIKVSNADTGAQIGSNSNPVMVCRTTSQIVNVDITLSASKGGVDITTQFYEPASKGPKACDSATIVVRSVANPKNQKTYAVGNTGRLPGGLDFDPGKYTAGGVCNIPNQTIKLPDQSFDITAGKLTPVTFLDNTYNPVPVPVTTGSGDSSTNCHSDGGFSWLLCGVIKTVIDVVDKIRENVIVPALREAPLTRTVMACSIVSANLLASPPVPASLECHSIDNPVYNIWAAFRNVSSVFFILVFFLIIIGTAAGFDNYSIKKILPHLVAGAIIMPFSWYLCAFVIDIGNVLGQGVVALVSSVVPAPQIDLTSNFTQLFGLGGGVVATFALIGAGATVGFGAVVSLLLAFCVVFLTLILRKLLILVCVVISPLAILAWVLPNTEKWAKQWWQNFLKLNLMYVIIMMLFEMGRVFSATAGSSIGAGNYSAATAWVVPLIEITGLILPLFMVPLAFKWAGSGLKAATGAVSKASGGLDKRFGKNSDSAKEAAQNRELKNLQRGKKYDNAASTATTRMSKLGNQMKSRMAHRRAGFATPLNSKNKGLFSNPTRALAREAAFSSAVAKQGILNANDTNTLQGLPPETLESRVDAERIKAQQTKITDRASRMGLVASEQQLGGVGSAGVAEGNRQIFNAAMDLSRRGAAAKVGDAVGYNRANAAQYLHATQVAAYADEHSEIKNTKERGEILGGLAKGHELDYDAQQANPGMSIQQAHALRMDRLGKSSFNAAGAAAIKSEIDVEANNLSNDDLDIEEAAEQLRRNSGGTLSLDAARTQMHARIAAGTAGADLVAARQRRGVQSIAAGASKGRTDAILNEQNERTYNDVESKAGVETARDIMTGGYLTQRQALIDARTKRSEAITAESARQTSTKSMLESSRESSNKAYAAQMGGVKGVQEAADAEAKQAGLTPRTIAAKAAAAIRSYDAAVSSKGSSGVDNFTAEQGILNADATALRLAQSVNPSITAEQSRAKNLGIKAKASTQNVGKSATEKLAADQATVKDMQINAEGNDLKNVYAAGLLNSADGAAVKSGGVLGTIEGGQTAIDKLIDTDPTIAALPPAMRRAAAQKRLVQDAATKARVDAGRKTANDYSTNASAQNDIDTEYEAAKGLTKYAGMAPDDVKEDLRRSNLGAAYSTAGAVGEIQGAKVRSGDQGSDRALNELIDDDVKKNALPGTPITPQMKQDAKRRVLAAAGTAAELAAANKTTADISADQGTVDDLDGQINAQISANNPGGLPTGAALSAARDQARAEVLGSRLADTSINARTITANRSAETRGNESAIGLSVATQNKARAELLQAQASANGTTLSSKDALAQAEISVRDENLGALADKARRDTAESSLTKTKNAIGENDKIRVQSRKDATRIAGDLRSANPALSLQEANNIAKAQAVALTEEKNLQSAGIAAQNAGGRKLAASVAKNTGIANDVNKEIDAVLGSNASAATPDERSAAAEQVQDRELTAISESLEREAEEANRTDPESGFGSNRALNGQVIAEQKNIIDKAATKLMKRKPKLTTKQARKLVKKDASVQAKIAGAGEKVETKNRADAIVADQETGRNKQITRVLKNSATRESRAATLEQSAANLARYKASSDAYKEIANNVATGADKVYEDTLAGSKAKALDDAKIEVDKENSDEADRISKLSGKSPAEKERKDSDVARLNLAIANAAVTAKARGEARAVNMAAEEKKKVIDRASAAATDAGNASFEKSKSKRYSGAAKEQAAYEIAAAGSAEQARISEATSQGSTNSYAQAALAPNALQAVERQIAATETSAASVAQKAAADRAMLNIRRPGEALNQTYLDTEASGTGLREEKILREAAEAASLENFTFTNSSGEEITTRIRGADEPNEFIDKAGNDIRDLLLPTDGSKPQIDRAIALGQEIAKQGYGTQELRHLQHTVFGGNAKRTVDPSLFEGRAKQIWDIIVSNIPPDSAPDLHAPSIAIHDGVSGEKLSKMNWRGQKAYFEYVLTDPSIEPPKRAKLVEEASVAIKDYVTSSRLNKSIDADNRKALLTFLTPPVVDAHGHYVADGNVNDSPRQIVVPGPNGRGTETITAEEALKRTLAKSFEGDGGPAAIDIIIDRLKTKQSMPKKTESSEAE